MLTNLLTDDLEATKNLFVLLLKFEVEFESDWFISLKGDDDARVGALLRTSEFVPREFQKSAQGVIVTVIVEAVDPVFDEARRLGIDVIEEPRDLPYGQRRLLLRDASGALVDVSAPTAPLAAEFRS